MAKYLPVKNGVLLNVHNNNIKDKYVNLENKKSNEYSDSSGQEDGNRVPRFCKWRLLNGRVTVVSQQDIVTVLP